MRSSYGYTFRELHELLGLPAGERIVQVGLTPTNQEPVIVVETEPVPPGQAR